MKAQISVETFFAVGVLLLLLIVFLVIVLNTNAMTQGFEETWSKEAACQKLASIVSAAFNAGDGAKWNGSLGAFGAKVTSDGWILLVDSNQVDANIVGNIAYYINCDHEPEAYLYKSISERPDLNVALYKTDSGGNPLCTANTPNPLGDIGDLIQNLSLYDLVVLEDSHLDGQLYLDSLESFVSTGNNFIASEHVLDKDKQGNKAGTNTPYFDGLYNKKNSYNDSIVVRSSTQFNLNVDDTMYFKQSPYVIPPNAEDAIASYCTDAGCDSTVPSVDSISQWAYGDGLVSFFSDFNTAFTGPRAGESFTDVVIEHIKSMGSYEFNSTGASLCSYVGKANNVVILGNISIENIEGTVVVSIE